MLIRRVEAHSAGFVSKHDASACLWRDSDKGTVHNGQWRITEFYTYDERGIRDGSIVPPHGVASDHLVLYNNVDYTAAKNWPRYLFCMWTDELWLKNAKGEWPHCRWNLFSLFRLFILDDSQFQNLNHITPYWRQNIINVDKFWSDSIKYIRNNTP